MKDSIERVVEQARRLTREGGDPGSAGEEAVRKELQELYSSILPVGVDPEDLR